MSRGLGAVQRAILLGLAKVEAGSDTAEAYRPGFRVSSVLHAAWMIALRDAEQQRRDAMRPDVRRFFPFAVPSKRPPPGLGELINATRALAGLQARGLIRRWAPYTGPGSRIALTDAGREAVARLEGKPAPAPRPRTGFGPLMAATMERSTKTIRRGLSRAAAIGGS